MNFGSVDSPGTIKALNKLAEALEKENVARKYYVGVDVAFPDSDTTVRQHADGRVDVWDKDSQLWKAMR